MTTELYNKAGVQLLHARDSHAWIRDQGRFKSFDAIIADPPYSSGGRTTTARKIDPNTKYQHTERRDIYETFSGDNRDQQSHALWYYLWMSDLIHLLKPGGIFLCFTDWRQYSITEQAMQAAGFTWQGVIVWDKTEGCRPRKGAPRAQSEFILWGTRGRFEPQTKQSIPGVITCAPLTEKKYHIAGKPAPMLRAIMPIIRPDGLILDPFTGSGSVPLAALQTGRRCVAMDCNLTHLETAKKRLEECRGVQQELFTS